MTNADKNSQYDCLVEAGLQNLILLPESDSYVERQASYWAANTALQPSRIVQPRTSEDVSRIIKVLANIDGPVALRSGGHTQWAGSNDVHEGVTIDLGRMTDVTYDSKSNLASLQPGSRWGDVYDKLLKNSVCVTGGRDGNVGIGGFLTGGGNSYYAGLYGLACDTVANFEVVLANGHIVNANAESYSDLWTALKGGSGNFGIVTRFDLYTFPAHDLWGGIRVSARSHGEQLAQTMVYFTNTNKNNPEAAFILNYTFGPSAPDVLAAHVIVDTNGTVNAPAFSEIQKIPTIIHDIKIRTMANMSNSYLLPSNQHQVWFSLTFKNDIAIITHAASMHDNLVHELKSLLPQGCFTTQCLFQPLPTLFAKHSVARGGNVLGLNKVGENALLWLITGSTETAEQHVVMREKLSAFSASLEKFGEKRGSGVKWRYLNYVDESQDPLGSYGEENVRFMRGVAEKYDPEGIFQGTVGSGWKIGRVGG